MANNSLSEYLRRKGLGPRGGHPTWIRRARYLKALRYGYSRPIGSRGQEFFYLRLLLSILGKCQTSTKQRDFLCRLYGTSLPDLREQVQLFRHRHEAAGLRENDYERYHRAIEAYHKQRDHNLSQLDGMKNLVMGQQVLR